METIVDVSCYIEGDRSILLDYEVTNFLGQGNNYVYEVKHKTSSKNYAIKIL